MVEICILTKGLTMRKLKLYNSEEYVLVDDRDYDWLSQYRWLRQKNGYARRLEWEDGKQKSFLMHREILGAPKGVLVDHINLDKKDNRRANLRLANWQQNSANRPKQNGSYRSKFKGVTRKAFPWGASITVENKSISLGWYSTEEEAALAYNEAALKYFGDFALLNKV